MGLPLDRVDQGDLVQLFLEGVSAGKGGWIVTPNLDVLRQFRADAGSRELVLAASHRVRMASRSSGPRGWPVHRCRRGFPAAISSSACLRPPPAPGYASSCSVEAPAWPPDEARRLQALNPGLEHVGSYSPALRIRGRSGGVGQDQGRTAGGAPNAGPGRPRLSEAGAPDPDSQARVSRRRRSPASGISLSFLTGDQSRAPTMLQRLGLEWLHRLLHEPRRLFRRYVVRGLPFSFMLFGWALAHRLWGR